MTTDFTVRGREYLTRISEFLTQVSGMSLFPLIASCDQFSSVLLTSPFAQPGWANKIKLISPIAGPFGLIQSNVAKIRQKHGKRKTDRHI
jgi:hypothetical protein